MFAPELTQEWYEICVERGLSNVASISKLNSKNCKQDFNKTIPKPLRDEGWNAFLVFRNHRNRWKYLGFNVENKAGALHIVNNPEFIWSGYVFHDNSWYYVNTEDLIAGKIKNSSKVLLPQIEHPGGVA